MPEKEKLIHELVKIRGMSSISVCINSKRTNVIMGEDVYTMWGKRTISDTIYAVDTEEFARTGQGVTFCISPLSFYQVNSRQAEKVYSVALEYANLTGRETVWDLYCGIGTISLFLAKAAKQVYGVEVIPQAIEDARRNASNNGIDNVEFFVGKAEEVLTEMYARGEAGADVIVVDPPRKGCEKETLDTIIRIGPERVVYVSCDSATLARDLKVLCDGGYRVEKVRGIDQFGQTVHVESVIMMQLVEK